MIETEKFAKLLCTKSSQSLRAIKKILISSMFLDVNELLEMEAREFSSVLQTDGKERIKQFFEKRNKV
jgi:enoyl-CoA hydratase/carnithine racemase